MKKLPKVGCLIMAAGNARRFGENKLAAKLDGRTLIERALDAVPREKFTAVVVVSQYLEILHLAESYGFVAVRNEHPDWGISHTIRLGTEILAKHCDAILYQVSDQPLLERESIAKEVDFYLDHSDHIVGMGHNGKRGNPCIFPWTYFPELLALREDNGGNTVIRAHEENLLLYEVNPEQLTDVDTPEALRKLTQA